MATPETERDFTSGGKIRINWRVPKLSRRIGIGLASRSCLRLVSSHAEDGS
jgi:hypothetical protein